MRRTPWASIAATTFSVAPRWTLSWVLLVARRREQRRERHQVDDGVPPLDGALASALPSHRYETVALLYPDVYYPGLPGWILASVQPFSAGVWAALLGWMVLLSVAIGAGSARHAARHDRSPVLVAAAVVVATFVVATVEAVASLPA